MEVTAKFQLKVSEKKDVIFFPLKFTDHWILSLDSKNLWTKGLKGIFRSRFPSWENACKALSFD